MILKTILSITMSVGLCLLTLSSCEQFLTEAPKGELNESNAFTDYDDAEALITSCYDGIQKGHEEYYMWYNLILSDCLSDNAYSGGDDVDINSIGGRTITPRNSVVNKSWKSLYGSILRCNVALTYIPQINDARLDAMSFGAMSRRQEMLGEVSFLRALHYYNLVKTFGDVPLVLTTGSTAPADVQVPRDSEEAVYAQIIRDLDFALNNLPDKRSTEGRTRGLATLGAANALMAKVYAMKGAPEDVDWTKVKQYSDAVLLSPVYKLLDVYDHLFDDKHRNNSETILAVQYIANTTENNYVPILMLPPSMTDQNWRKYLTPSQSLVKAFDDAGDVVRKASTIIYEDINNLWFDQYYAQQKSGQWITGSIPFSYKSRAINRVGWDCGDLIYILRLGDIALLNAEAMNQLSGHTAAASSQYLSRIRSRAGLGMLNPSSKEEMTKLLLNERRLELAYEGERFFDLKRYGIAKSVIDNTSWVEIVSNQKTVVSGELPSYMTLMPIPQDERDRNPQLTQNEGYSL